MKKIGKIIIIILIGFLIGFTIYQINPRLLSADSGFDYSYDGGGSSYDGGSSWSGSSYSSHDYSWSGSSSSGGSGSGWEMLIYFSVLFVIFVASIISEASKVRNNPQFQTKETKSLTDKLYDIFYDVHSYNYLEKYNDLKLLVTDNLYKKMLNNSKEIKENIVTHDNTRIIEKSDNRIVLEFILKTFLYKKINNNIQRLDDNVLEKNKYIVEFIKENNIWKINSIEKTFLQNIEYKQPSYSVQVENFKQVDISKYIKDKELFLKERFNDYVAIQEAWMNFDYDALKDKLTNELYNQYEMQLETLKAKKEKNVMKGFVNNGITINNVVEENNNVTTNIILHVSQIDYIEKNGKCVRGNSAKLNKVSYNLTFISSLDDKDKKCPNCGNPLEDISSQTCKFCHSTISFTPKKWVMSKKQVRNQR